MRKACLVVPFLCQKNRIFDLSDSFINRDGCMVPFAMLRDRFARGGYDLSTNDINTVENSEVVIYLEMPSRLPTTEEYERSNLLLFETELILPENWNFEKHKRFSRIFTWNDSLIDNRRYFKTNWSHVFPKHIEYSWQEKPAFCCVISGNKTSSHPLELYSKRVEAIRWFEKHHPDMFDLYGMGWNEVRLRGAHYFEKYRFLGLFKRLLNIFAARYPSYRGKVAGKLETLRKYRFSICYENARDIPGYITEKIFDCFFAGTVPVYWGAGNVEQLISSDCYIDRRKFTSYEELFVHLDTMTPETHAAYVTAAERYLESQLARQFTAEYFAETIFNNSAKSDGMKAGN